MLKYAKIISYNVNKYPFAQFLSHCIFKVKHLNMLHFYLLKQSKKDKLCYQDNLKLRNLMQRLEDDSLFYKIYHKWIYDNIANRYGKKITYSAHPKMRVHLAGTESVSNFHRDADITKNLEQINCYLPFTDVCGNNSILCETSYGLKNYHPINLKYGEALLWDGGLLEHGTLANDTNFTRISCDFRFQPKNPKLVKYPWSDILSGRKIIR